MGTKKTTFLSTFSPIRNRILAGFVLMAFFPAIGISIGAVILGYVNGLQQAVNQLESVADLKDLELSNWSESLQDVLVAAQNEEYAPDRASIVLRLANSGKRSETYIGAMRSRLRLFVHQNPGVEEILVLDREGTIVISTVIENEGSDVSRMAYFQAGLQSAAFQLLLHGAETPWVEGVWMFAARPVQGPDGEVLGVIALRASSQRINEILGSHTGLGGSGKLYLASPIDILTTGDYGLQIIPFANTFANRSGQPGIYPDYIGSDVVGVYKTVSGFGFVLAAEQGLREAFQAVFTTLGINIAFSLLAVLLAGVASYFITRSITGPLVGLADTATQIARGDLGQTAPVKREDEVGMLAVAFNSMTGQLRELIANLEDRVEERTHALRDAIAVQRRHSLQLETSATVSREITSILSIDELLARVVDLIRTSFGYYYVNIWLLDEDELVLKASTQGEDISHMRIPLDSASLNAEAVRTNQAVSSNDVRNDVRYLADENLPETRAEMVVPLHWEEKVIGSLDISSAEPGTFNELDAVVLQGLGDQVAIAIENAHLYERSRELAVVEERNRLARDLHDSVTQSLCSLNILAEGWRRLVAAGERDQIETYLERIGQMTDQALKEMRLMIYELRPPSIEKEGLLGALHQRFELVEDRVGIEARLKADGYIDLPAPIEEGLYWIAREALSNVLKHSRAASVTVNLVVLGGSAILEISDNGCGFDHRPGKTYAGLGLVSMLERARHLGGTLEIVSQPGEGTVVRSVVPVHRTGSGSTPLHSEG